MGTKNGCGEGHCGACTVIVDGEAVRACIYKASRIDGKQVETIEGVARDGVLHPLQQAFIEAGAVQCGFCTPGMIMAAKALLDKKTDPDDDDIRAAMKHNLCRCTGYSKILEAVHIAAGTAAKSDSRSQHAGSHIVGNGLPRTEATRTRDRR